MGLCIHKVNCQRVKRMLAPRESSGASAAVCELHGVSQSTACLPVSQSTLHACGSLRSITYPYDVKFKSTANSACWCICCVCLSYHKMVASKAAEHLGKPVQVQNKQPIPKSKAQWIARERCDVEGGSLRQCGSAFDSPAPLQGPVASRLCCLRGNQASTCTQLLPLQAA